MSEVRHCCLALCHISLPLPAGSSQSRSELKHEQILNVTLLRSRVEIDSDEVYGEASSNWTRGFVTGHWHTGHCRLGEGLRVWAIL